LSHNLKPKIENHYTRKVDAEPCAAAAKESETLKELAPVINGYNGFLFLVLGYGLN
jgi:hypothetical protein